MLSFSTIQAKHFLVETEDSNSEEKTAVNDYAVNNNVISETGLWYMSEVWSLKEGTFITFCLTFFQTQVNLFKYIFDKYGP